MKLRWTDQFGRILSERDVDEDKSFFDQLMELLKGEWAALEPGDSITLS